MTEETIKALAGILTEIKLKTVVDLKEPEDFDAVEKMGAALNKIFLLANKADKMLAALSGTEPLNGEEDEYVEKVKKIMEANEMGVAEAIVDEIIMPIKNGARQYWQAAQTKHEELRKLENGTERVECYLPCGFSESEIYAGTEAGPLPLKLVTLTVVRESDCGTSKKQSGMELWDIKYHSTYSVWDQRIESFLANNSDDALNQFWEGKNKEGYEIMSVNKRQQN